VALATAVVAANSSAFAPPSTNRPLIIAHRGLGQTFHREGLTGETCTASRIFPPEHPYLENTIESFQAAFDAGADMVEFDVHPTTDGHFVVFHDWTLDCRTDGTGVTREHSLAELQALDIGYGYTADGGRTYPFRGKGIGLMPTLAQVLDALPNQRFLINVKSNDPAEGRLLAQTLARLPAERRALIATYGGGAAVEEFAAALPDVMVLRTDDARRCLVQYELLGWLGIVPDTCRNTLFMIPLNLAPLAWGFPDRLTARLAEHGSRLVMLGAYDGSGFSSGVDEVSELDGIPTRFDGFIWTNRVDRIGPAVAAR
jgi:glycerophosphoryl diester phosphodiesterase